jgi:hypoxanthine-guanine phosphoribosyltransferase
MSISLLEMGRTKKRSVREAVISILSNEFPLSTKKIFNRVKKDHNLSVTYQAVFKSIQEMIVENVLEKIDKEYKLNITWIENLENEIKIIKHSYVKGEGKSHSNLIQERINTFVSEIGPRVKSAINKEELHIIGISGGGRLFAIALWKYLLKEGIKIKYSEFDVVNESSHEKLLIENSSLEDKKILVVDSAIYSGKTYEIVMNKLSRLKKNLKYKDIFFIADTDVIGLADLSRQNQNTK